MATALNFDVWNHPFSPYAAGWCRLIERAMEFKKEEFQADADDIKKFFSGTKGDFWSSNHATGKHGYMGEDSSVPQPDFQMILMKVAEAVQVFGPSLYSTDPIIEVDPLKRPVMPPTAFGITPSLERQVQEQMAMAQQQGQQPPQHPFIAQYEAYLEKTQMYEMARKAASAVLAAILNYNQREFGAKDHARRTIDDALISGMGVRWTEIHTPPASSRKYACSSYDSIERLALDPDACHEEEIQWAARKRILPYWQAEDKWEHKKGTLKKYSTLESTYSQEFQNSKHLRAKGESNDLLCCWEIYSKMGIGNTIPGIAKDSSVKLPELGQFVYLVVSPHIPFFINLPSDDLEKMDEEDVFMRLQWPIPYWADGKSNGWPFTPMSFHKVPGHIWPMSHFKPGMGELKWLTWAMSFLANKVRTSCGTMIAVLKSAGEDLKKALEANVDNKVIELSSLVGENINNVVSFLQQPPFHGDIWKVVEAVFNLWDKRIGLSELLYGMTDTQDRSATETATKQENASARISDMRAQVEDHATMVARKEVMAIRWLYKAEDVDFLLGEEGTRVFEQDVITADLESLVREYEYSVVAGSTRLQDRQVKINNLNTFLSNFGQVFAQFAGQGIVEPINAIMSHWGKLYSTDTQDFQIHIPPPPPAPPDPRIELEMQKMQFEMQKMQADAQLDREAQQADMAMKQQELEFKQMEMAAKLEFEEAKNRAEIEAMMVKAEAEIQIEREKAAVELQIMREEAQMKMAVSQQEATQDAELQQNKAAVDLEVAEVKAASDMQVNQQKAQSDSAIAKQKADSDVKVQKEKSKADIQTTKEKGKVQNEVAKEKVKIEAKKASQPKPKK